MSLPVLLNPTYSAEKIRRLAGARGCVVIELERGETAWNPTSTRRLLSGPQSVEFRCWEDGGVDATVLPTMTQHTAAPRHERTFLAAFREYWEERYPDLHKSVSWRLLLRDEDTPSKAHGRSLALYDFLGLYAWLHAQMPQCPDGGTCHHRCHEDDGKCFRVQSCAPLSTYGDTWDAADKAAHS